MSLQIAWRDTGTGVLIATLEGRLNMASAPQLDAAVESALVAGWPRITLDLSALEFIDSSGLGALVAAFKAAARRGAELRLAEPSWQVQMVLKLTNMDQILTIHADAETAFA